MPAPDEPSAPPPRWPWLDRWFEPPWRALLTWVALAWLMHWVVRYGGYSWIMRMCGFFVVQLDRALPVSVPPVMRDIAFSSNCALLAFWFEPLALRLDLPRSLAWLVLRFLTLFVLLQSDVSSMPFLWPVILIASSALSMLVLRGWRSRPWMALIAGAWDAGVNYYIWEYFTLPASVPWPLVIPLAYAAVLLYGTRPLPR